MFEDALFRPPTVWVSIVSLEGASTQHPRALPAKKCRRFPVFSWGTRHANRLLTFLKFSGVRPVIIKVGAPQLQVAPCQQFPSPYTSTALAMSILSRSDLFPLGILMVLFSWTLLAWYSSKKRFPYSPGPKRLPIVGNLFSMPSSQEWVTYRKWSDEFGMTLWCKLRLSQLEDKYM